MGNVCAKNGTRRSRTLAEVVHESLGLFDFNDIPLTNIKKSPVLKHFYFYLMDREKPEHVNAFFFYISYLLNRQELNEITSISLKSSFQFYELIKNSKIHSLKIIKTFFDDNNSEYFVPLKNRILYEELSDAVLEKDCSDNYDSNIKLLEKAFCDSSVTILENLYKQYIHEPLEAKSCHLD
uniref:Uncharacterized protein n=2 Tax=Lepeophtheirus salmonis TaxID=72036 RepID=A0A0K2TWL7_LEPSM|nr:uncharacterized protein LOC121114959 [Lepeophtheirus salmonis]